MQLYTPMQYIIKQEIKEKISSRAAYWLSIFNELKSRGVQDILIACMDGIKGLLDALKASFSHIEVQLCVIHLLETLLNT